MDNTRASLTPTAWRPCGPRHARGFTLLEAMITVAILAIILAIAVPSFKNLIASRAMTGHVSTLASAIRLTRSEAIKRGTRVSICQNTDPAAPSCGSSGNWADGWVIFVDRGGAAIAADDVILVQPPLSNSGGIIHSPTGSIGFIASGIAPGAQSSFLLRPQLAASDPSYSTLSRRVCMNSTGNTRLIIGDGACGG